MKGDAGPRAAMSGAAISGAVPWLCWVGIGVCLMGLWGCEPDRRFTEIDEFTEPIESVSFDVEAGGIKVFGALHETSVWLERWTPDGAGVGPLVTEIDGEHLHIASRCTWSGPCHVELDLTIPQATDVDIALGRGDVDVFRTSAEVVVDVGKGDVVGRRLTSPVVRIEVEEGNVDLRFDYRPELVEVRVGEGDIRLRLPRFRYKCEFDREADGVEIYDLYCHRLVDQILRLETGAGRVEVVLYDWER